MRRSMRRVVAGALLLWGAAGPARAEGCPEPRHVVEVDGALAQAEGAFAARDTAGFTAASDRARAALPCVVDPVAPALAARYHLAEGLRSFLVDRDALATTLSFTAARAVAPDAPLAPTLAPPGHPLQSLYGAALPGATALAPVPRPAQGEVRVDGRVASTRVTDRPSIVQVLDGAGAVTVTRYLRPGDPLPPYPPLPAVAAPGAADTTVAPTTRSGRPVTWTGAAGLVGAGALYLAAFTLHERYDGLTAAEQQDADGLVAANHGLVVASGALGATGLVVGVVGVVARW